MKRLTQVELKAPYLVFIGDVDSATYAKTAAGLVQWCPNEIKGQLRFEGNSLDLGVEDLTIEKAVTVGVKSLVIGVAPVGGEIGEEWIEALVLAAKSGLDIVSGLHRKLTSYPELVAAAKASNVKLIDVRVPSKNLPIGNCRKRSGKRMLMVGTDCAVGKKYTALAITKLLKNNNVNASFRATGQTGIMIAGNGVPIDSVVADFISGAAEVVSPDNEESHWDIIEGQGSLFNPSYSGVSLGLLHGSQPDAIVLCHDPSRKFISSCPILEVPDVMECIELTLACARLVNTQVECFGISVNTSHMTDDERKNYLESLEKQTGLPCFDPLINGCEAILNKVRN